MWLRRASRRRWAVVRPCRRTGAAWGTQEFLDGILMLEVTWLESWGRPQGPTYSLAAAGCPLVEAGWQPMTETAEQLIDCSVMVINYSVPSLLCRA